MTVTGTFTAVPGNDSRVIAPGSCLRRCRILRSHYNGCLQPVRRWPDCQCDCHWQSDSELFVGLTLTRSSNLERSLKQQSRRHLLTEMTIVYNYADMFSSLWWAHGSAIPSITWLSVICAINGIIAVYFKKIFSFYLTNVSHNLIATTVGVLLIFKTALGLCACSRPLFQ